MGGVGGVGGGTYVGVGCGLGLNEHCPAGDGCS